MTWITQTFTFYVFDGEECKFPEGWEPIGFVCAGRERDMEASIKEQSGVFKPWIQILARKPR